MKLIALDPSGNYGKEGMGTTGIAFMEDGIPVELLTVSAKDFSSECEYWDAVITVLEKHFPDHIVMEGYKLYNHKGMAAKSQANSELQTPQIIGVIKYFCYRMDIPYTIQFASDVKTRWQESILAHLGHLEAKNGFYYFNGEKTVTHTRDALKHALHWWNYGRKKLK